MKKFHITITNNETGETIRDHDTDAILAVVDHGDQTGTIALVECDTETILNVVNRLEELTKMIYKENPELFFLLKAFRVKEAKEAEEATDETTEN